MKNKESGYLEQKNECLVYQKVDGTNWLVIDRVIPGTIEGAYKMIRNTTMLFDRDWSKFYWRLCICIIQRKLNKPVQMLKRDHELY